MPNKDLKSAAQNEGRGCIERRLLSSRTGKVRTRPKSPRFIERAVAARTKYLSNASGGSASVPTACFPLLSLRPCQTTTTIPTHHYATVRARFLSSLSLLSAKLPIALVRRGRRCRWPPLPRPVSRSPSWTQHRVHLDARTLLQP